MGLDNKVIFPDFKTTIIDKDNPTANYTREADGVINRIDGRSKIVKYTKWVKGYLNADGSISIHNNYQVTENYIDISHIKNEITIETKSQPYLGKIVFFDSSKNVISLVGSNTSTIPSGSKYIKFSMNNNGILSEFEDVVINGQIEYGYKGIVNTGLLNTDTQKYDISICTKKNYTDGDILHQGYPTAINTTRNYLYIKKIPVTPNKTYWFKRSPSNSQMNIYKFYDNEYGNGDIIGQFYSGYDSRSFVVPDGVEFITVAFLGGVNSVDTCYLQEGLEFIEYQQNAVKTISIEQPLRQANSTVYDSIYKFTDGNYYLFKKVGNRPYQDGDLNNPDVITNGTTTNYDLGRAGYTEVQLTNFDPNIKIFGTNTTFSCDSNMPSIELELPICYAYNESKKKYKGEVIDINEVDIDERKNTDIVSIEGQTFTNLLQEPLESGKVITPVELQGRECTYNGGKTTTVPLREIEGDTYINLLEDKIENATLKPVASYSGEVVNGKNVVNRYKKEELVVNTLSNINGEALVDANWVYIEQYIPILNGCTKIQLDNVDISRQVRVCFYTENNSYISSITSATVKIYNITSIPSTAKKIRFSCSMGADGHLGGGIIQLVMDTTDYNLNTGDKVTIDKIKGNTKIYHEGIPIAEPTGNMFTSKIIKQNLNANNGVQDKETQRYFGTDNYIYVGNRTGNLRINLFDANNNKVPTGTQVARYDENIRYQGGGNYVNDVHIYMDENTKFIKFNLIDTTSLNVDDGYKVVISTNSPDVYSEPVIVDYKVFPIQSVGELYVNELGEPILDELGNEQFKVDIVSENYYNMVQDITPTFRQSNGANITPTSGRHCKFSLSSVSQSVDVALNGVNNIIGRDKWCLVIIKFNVDITNFTFKLNQGYKIFGDTLVYKGLAYGGDNIQSLILDSSCGFELNKTYSVDIVAIIQDNGKEFMLSSLSDYKSATTSILLPQPLRKLRTNSQNKDVVSEDTLYWDGSKNKYCIEKKTYIKIPIVSDANWNNNWTMIDGVKVVNAYQFEFFADDIHNSTNGSPHYIMPGFTNNRYNYYKPKKDILNLDGYHNFMISYPIGMGIDTVEKANKYLQDNKSYLFYHGTPEVIETNIAEKITMPCYNNSTYIYTNGASSHDDINLPAIEPIKGELLATTIPLSTKAYIKPSTKYTIFMDTDYEVNYNLGGVEGLYKKISPNIINDFKIIPNTQAISTGDIQSNSYHTTDYQPISASQLWFKRLHNTGANFIVQYDENKKFLGISSNYWQEGGDLVLMAEGTRYIRVNFSINTVLDSLILTEYAVGGKVLLTTPETLINNTLTLLGEGNIGNVTLLEGDYTNSYVPEKFINDVFSVGDLEPDGSYKIDIISRNNTVNIFNEDMFREIPPKQVIDGFDYYINSTIWGSLEGNSTFHISGNFKENTQYTFHYDVYNTANTWANVVMVHADGTEYVVSSSNRFITSKPNKTLKAIYIKSGMMTSGVIGIGKVQIEEGVEISEYVKPVKKLTPIYLPCQLMKVGDIKDRFYWDSTRDKMCIEKYIKPIEYTTSYDFSSYWYNEAGLSVTIPDAEYGYLICNGLTSFDKNHSSLHGVITSETAYRTGITDRTGLLRIRINPGMTFDDMKKWLVDNKVIIYYVSKTPTIIETNITKPIEIDLFDTETSVTTISTVEPNLYMRSDTLSRPVTIKPSTKYYVHAKTTGDITVNLGGSEIQYVSSDIVKEITTPSSIKENTIFFVGNCNISNVMLREDNRTDIKYFNGVIHASTLQSDGKYKTVINIMSSNSTDYDRTINIITTSPLESGTSIVVQNGVFKVLKADGSYEDIISTDGETSITSNCKKITASGEVNGIISIIVPYRSIRPLKAPTNLSFNNYLDSDRHTFAWNTDVGVEGHKFYYKNELVGTVENPTPNFTYPSEMEGNVKVVAYNTLTESEPLIQNITTLPNRTEIVDFDAKYLNDEYKITVKFNDNSNIKKGYKFIYSVDNGEKKTIDMPVTDNAVVLSQSISVKDITDNAVISINTYNDVGEVEISPKTFYLTPTPKWTYLASSNKLMFRLIDKFNFRTNYNLVSKKNNVSDSQEVTEVMGTNGGVQGLLIDYLKDSNAEEELTVSIVMDDENFTHIPCKPFNVSKTLDLSLVAPKNFTMEWVSEGVAKFSWDDNYINEEYFEFNYSLNNGLAENVKVYPEDVEGQGGRLSYTYSFAEYGSLTAKVRMVWELNSSEYTDTKTATFVAVTGLPPSWVVKRYDEDRLIISWEAQSYVDHYEVKIECDGKIELKNLVVDMFDLDLTKYGGKYVDIAIKTYYVTGVETEYSNSILFKPISNSNTISEMTYTPVNVNKDDNISVYTKVYDRYITYQKIMGSIANSNLINVKIFKENIRKDALMNMVFTHLVNEVYSDFVSIKTDNVSSGAYLHVLNYANIIKKGLLNTMIYTPIQNRLTDFMSVQRVTIVCIGDSITAGHPGFWAESMTGNIESQYEYWLNKRLNNQYDIINKGFGSDRTYNVLARFKADVLDLHPQYCIIQAGK